MLVIEEENILDQKSSSKKMNDLKFYLFLVGMSVIIIILLGALLIISLLFLRG